MSSQELPRRSVRDPALLDHLSRLTPQANAFKVWRVTREERDPLQSSRPKGRWDDGRFDVLYTSCDANGACAEIHFHISRGQPVFPSRMRFKLYEIAARINHMLDLTDSAVLRHIGVNAEHLGKLAYARKDEEYDASQHVGEASHFLSADAILVPNARWSCNNLVLFTSRIKTTDIKVIRDCGLVDFAAWEKQHNPTRH